MQVVHHHLLATVILFALGSAACGGADSDSGGSGATSTSNDATADEAPEPDPITPGGKDYVSTGTGIDSIMAASREGNFEIVTLLIKEGSDPNFSMNDGLSVLHVAAAVNSADTVRVLLESGADPNCQQAIGATPLHMAVQAGSLPIIKLLLENKANPNLADRSGVTPLIAAQIFAKLDAELRISFAEILVAGGADINQTDSLGTSPLIAATYMNHPGMAAWLIERRADLDLAGDVGNTAVHYAVRAENMELLSLLIEAGANINLKTQDEEALSPLDLARGLENEEMAAYLSDHGAS